MATIKLTFHKNTLANRKRYLKPTAPFLTHLPPEAPSYFAQGEVDKIPGLKEVK